MGKSIWYSLMKYFEFLALWTDIWIWVFKIISKQNSTLDRSWFQHLDAWEVVASFGEKPPQLAESSPTRTTSI